MNALGNHLQLLMEEPARLRDAGFKPVAVFALANDRYHPLAPLLVMRVDRKQTAHQPAEDYGPIGRGSGQAVVGRDFR